MFFKLFSCVINLSSCQFRSAKKHRTRARASFEREQDLDTQSSSSMTPERDSEGNKTKTGGETRTIVDSGSPKIATSAGSDSEYELEKELEKLER